jgi:DNA ligase-1
MTGFRPLLSPQDDPKKNPDFFKRIQKAFPLLCSPKYDGVRGVVKGSLMSRTFKILPSYQAQDQFARASTQGYDGELIEGCETDPDVFNRTSGHIRAFDKPGNLRFFVFDNTHDSVIHLPFHERHASIAPDNPGIIVVEHAYIEDLDELLAYEAEQLEKGFEGIMMRDPFGSYKNGRATFNEGIIFKLKRFEDAEGVVIRIEEALHNTNEKKINELGFAKRSDTKDAKSSSGRVGRFFVEFSDSQFPDLKEIKVATGTYKHDELEAIWSNPSLVIGKPMKFRFMRNGAKDMPRHARALGLRDPTDM